MPESDTHKLPKAYLKPCLQCGYNLFGRNHHDPCPECGLNGQASFNDGNLIFSDLGYLRRTRLGLLIVLAGAILQALVVLVTWEGLFRRPAPDLQPATVPLLSAGAGAAILSILGWSLVCLPEPHREHRDRRWVPRRVALYSGFVVAGGSAAMIVAGLLGAAVWEGVQRTAGAATLPIAVLAAWLVHYAFSMMRLHSIVLRIPDRAVAQGILAMLILGTLLAAAGCVAGPLAPGIAAALYIGILFRVWSRLGKVIQTAAQ